MVTKNESGLDWFSLLFLGGPFYAVAAVPADFPSFAGQGKTLIKIHPDALSERVSKEYNGYNFVDWRLSDI